MSIINVILISGAIWMPETNGLVNGATYFDGSIRDFKVYTEALSVSGIKEQYRLGVIKYNGYHSVITIK